MGPGGQEGMRDAGERSCAPDLALPHPWCFLLLVLLPTPLLLVGPQQGRVKPRRNLRHRHEVWVKGRTYGAPAPNGTRRGHGRGQAGASHVLP